MTSATRCACDRAPTFRMALRRCVFTVLSAIPRSSAISRARCPIATWLTISSSRGLSMLACHELGGRARSGSRLASSRTSSTTSRSSSRRTLRIAYCIATRCPSGVSTDRSPSNALRCSNARHSASTEAGSSGTSTDSMRRPTISSREQPSAVTPARLIATNRRSSVSKAIGLADRANTIQNSSRQPSPAAVATASRVRPNPAPIPAEVWHPACWEPGGAAPSEARLRTHQMRRAPGPPLDQGRASPVGYTGCFWDVTL
jgi:hypothetical protein